MVSATLDTSVYIRALHLGGPAATLIGYARMGELRIDVSEPIMDEVMRVLRGKFEWSAEMTHFTRQKLTEISNRVSPAQTVNVIEFDPPDNRVLECAAEAGSDYRRDPDAHRARRPRLMRAFRLCRANYPAYDGEGARRVGGRWNSKGTRVLYMSENRSLAVLEILVHLSATLPDRYVLGTADVPDDITVEILDETGLPAL